VQGPMGRTLGQYQIVAEIGRGGMAVVYKAYQESLNRYVAVKVLREELARDRQFVARFHREAVAVARLNHPNILQVYDTGVVHGIYYIVMDYVDGRSLESLLARGPLPMERAIAIAVQLAEALAYAHRQGLVHRDVKPGNILLTRSGQPLLTDFGIAKALDGATRLTQTGMSIGTPAYMAPEQIQGQPADNRTDIYALGIVLYEMLTGVAPFSAPTPVGVIYKQMNEPPPPLRQMNSRVPAWLEAVVDKALSKNPLDRYQRVDDLAQVLRQRRAPARTGERRQPGAPVHGPLPSSSGASNPPRRNELVPFLVGMVVVCLLALAGGGIYLFLANWMGAEGTLTQASPPAMLASPPITATLAPTFTPTPLPTAEPDTPTAVVALATTPTPMDTPTEAVPTPLPSATLVPTPIPTAIPPTRTPTPRPEPTREPGLIADFETFGTWKIGDEPYGTFTQSAEQVHQGSFAGRLDYHFDTPGNDYVVFRQTQRIAGQPQRITAWVYGDGSGHFLNVWIEDSGGQVWQVPLGRVSHTGWQHMVGVLDVNQAWPWTHISGPDNGVIEYPVSFVALVLDDGADDYVGSGTIYIDDLRADGGSS
jgi:serine/threonine protein kinase